MFKTGIVNLILRGFTLAGKFVLLLFMARYLSTELLGTFGLLSVTVAIALFFLGMDFYAYNTRELLARDIDEWTPLIRDQLVFHGMIYVAVLPLLLLVFVSGTLAWKYAGWFYLILILEHLSQESYRLLITCNRSSMANAVLFLRSGFWIYALVGTWYVFDTGRNLSAVWFGWSLGAAASLVLTVLALRVLPWRRVIDVSIDWRWIRQGTTVCLPFFVATLALLGVQYADRYFIQHFYGESMVGIYTFFASIANVIYVFVFTGITMVLHPRIVKAYRRGEFAEYRRHLRKLALGTCLSVAALVIGMSLLIRPVLSLVGKPIYAEHLSVFWIILGAVSVLTISQIPHFALYAKMQDRAIIISSISAFVVALAACSILVPRYGIMGAASATLCAMLTLAFGKTWYLMRFKGAVESPTPDMTPKSQSREEVIA